MAVNDMMQCINIIGLLMFTFTIYSSITVAVPLTMCYSDEFLQVVDNGTTVCIPCTICPPGQGATVRCTNLTDTKCENCTGNRTFSSLHSSFYGCVSCGTCDNSEVIAPCTPTRNTKCGPCLPGYFRDLLSMRCRKCAYCYPEYPGLSTRIPDCRLPELNRNFQCLPLLFPPAFQPTQSQISRFFTNAPTERPKRTHSQRPTRRNRDRASQRRSIPRNM